MMQVKFELKILLVPEMPGASQDNVSSLAKTREANSDQMIAKYSGIDEYVGNKPLIRLRRLQRAYCSPEATNLRSKNSAVAR